VRQFTTHTVREGSPRCLREKGVWSYACQKKATAQRKAITNELGPLHGDHSEGSTPLRVKKDVAHGRGDCGGSKVRTKSRRHSPLKKKRTEPNESGRFGKSLPTYGAGDDKAGILDAGPEPSSRPP
jgi:hypothetical protein